jgi:hypothetical protein
VGKDKKQRKFIKRKKPESVKQSEKRKKENCENELNLKTSDFDTKRLKAVQLITSDMP